jgi:hypothetical protein
LFFHSFFLYFNKKKALHQRKMKVIGAGQGRTGTTSLRQALVILGFSKTYHMDEVFDKPEHLKVWHAAAQGKNKMQMFINVHFKYHI